MYCVVQGMLVAITRQADVEWFVSRKSKCAFALFMYCTRNFGADVSSRVVQRCVSHVNYFKGVIALLMYYFNCYFTVSMHVHLVSRCLSLVS